MTPSSGDGSPSKRRPARGALWWAAWNHEASPTEWLSTGRYVLTSGTGEALQTLSVCVAPLDGEVKGAGIWLTLADLLVALNDQHCRPELSFQPRAFATEFHTAASGASDNLRIFEQFVEENRLVKPFPV